jgi:hypothetical protein
VLDTIRTKTLQRELDQAAAAGYRVAFGDPTHNILILEKTAKKYEYRVLQGLKDRINTAAAEGFGAIPTTFSGDMYKPTAVILEKSPSTSSAHDYMPVATVRTGSLQKELNEAAAKGYELAAISTYGANTVLMEKSSPAAPVVADRYLLLATARVPTMRNEINEAASKGYAVVAGSGGDELIVIMERAETPHEYLLLSNSGTTGLEEGINEAAARGFRPLPRTLLALTRERSMFGLAPDQTSIVMEKITGPGAFTYKIIGTKRVGTFKKELDQAANEGFEMIAFTLSYHEQVGLLRRTGAPPAKIETTPASTEVSEQTK